MPARPSSPLLTGCIRSASCAVFPVRTHFPRRSGSTSRRQSRSTLFSLAALICYPLSTKLLCTRVSNSLTGSAGAFHLYFDDVTHDVRLLEGDRSQTLKVKSETLFNKAHRHELVATLANEVTATV